MFNHFLEPELFLHAIRDHQNLILRTGKRDNVWPSNDFVRLNSVLGLCGETAEFYELLASGKKEKFADELGDIFWYLHYSCFAIDDSDVDTIALHVLMMLENYHLGEQDASKHFHDLMVQCGLMADIVKKNYCHKAPLKVEAFKECFQKATQSWARLCFALGMDIPQVIYQNINKLNKRYPDGFSTAASIARADERQ